MSVVIATRNRCGFLTDLARCLESQTCRDVEVVLVDDCSSDETWAVIQGIVATAQVPMCALRLGSHLGQGGARSVAVRNTRGSIVAFTDDDCLPTPGWLAHLCGPFAATGCRGHQPATREGASPIERNGDTEPTPAGSAPLPFSLVVQGRTEGWQGDANPASAWDRTQWVTRPSWLFETCNIAYRRTDLVLAGCFPSGNECLVAPHGRVVGEDTLAGWRVLESGARFVFARDALVYHRHLPLTYLGWLGEQRGRSIFPELVSRSRLGTGLLWHRWFLSRRTAAFDIAVLAACTSIATRNGWWAAGSVPWGLLAFPEARERGGRSRLLRLFQIAIGDVVGLTWQVAGSIRARRIVL